MLRTVFIAGALVAFVAFAAVSSLSAQNKAAGAYVFVSVDEITDPELFKTLVPKTGPAIAAAGGMLLIGSQHISALSGSPPARVAVISFENAAKARAWYSSVAQQEVNAINAKSSKSRFFIVEAPER